MQNVFYKIKIILILQNEILDVYFNCSYTVWSGYKNLLALNLTVSLFL